MDPRNYGTSLTGGCRALKMKVVRFAGAYKMWEMWEVSLGLASCPPYGAEAALAWTS